MENPSGLLPFSINQIPIFCALNAMSNTTATRGSIQRLGYISEWTIGEPITFHGSMSLASREDMLRSVSRTFITESPGFHLQNFNILKQKPSGEVNTNELESNVKTVICLR